jgi:membrane protease YdiL (CAAX protease family)
MAAIRNHPLVAFFVLAYALAWSFWIPYAIGVSPNPVFASGPLIAAIIVTALIDGKSGLKALLSRMVRWRVELNWYAVALLLALGAYLFAAFLNILLGATASLAESLGHWYFHFLLFPLYLLSPLSGAFGEELGWRGYALPRLQAGRSALFASLVLGVLIVGWHLPKFEADQISWSETVGILAAAILFTWLFINTNGSVLLAMLFHASGNTFPVFFFPMFSGADQVRLAAGVLCVAAVIVVIVAGPAHLSRKHRKQEEPAQQPTVATTALGVV